MNTYCILVTQTRTTECYVEATSPEEAQLLVAKECVTRLTDTTPDEWSGSSLSLAVHKC